jgi:hypothetical protein
MMKLSPRELESLEYCWNLRRKSAEKYKNVTLEERFELMEFKALELDRRQGYMFLYDEDEINSLPHGSWAEARYWELKPIVEAWAAKDPGNPAYEGINGYCPVPQGGNGHGTGDGQVPGTGDGQVPGPADGQVSSLGDRDGQASAPATAAHEDVGSYSTPWPEYLRLRNFLPYTT